MNNEKKKKNRKIIIFSVLFIVVVVAAILIFFLRPKTGNNEGSDDEFLDDFIEGEEEYFEIGSVSAYSGVVEAEESLEINKDSDKKISEVFVSLGDEVTEGQALFSYDTADLSLQLEQLKIELDSMSNDISDYNNQIKSLNQQLSETTDEGMKLDIRMQISELNTAIRQSNLSQKTKQAEIDSIQKSIANSTVTSKISGVVKSIKESETEEGAYMTILATGNYRVKCTVDEMNVGFLSEGMKVNVLSRTDEKKWEGEISKIDTEDLAENNNNYYYDSGNGESSTKYYFYVSLKDGDGLLLGQHVIVEPEE